MAESLVSYHKLVVWEVIKLDFHEPIKKVMKVERNLQENRISFEWGFSTKRFDSVFRDYLVEFSKDFSVKKISVEIFQEVVNKISPMSSSKVEFSIRIKKRESRKSIIQNYFLSEGDKMILNFSSILGIEYIEISFSEERNSFVMVAKTTMRFII